VVIQMAISRSREYQADAIGARFAGSSEGVASALEKLGAFSRRLPMEANPSTAHMFIVNPLSGGGFRSLFSTHPPIEERIARLRGARPPKPPGAGPRQDEAVDAMQKGRSYWDALS
jgi:heat shock protein HtpX